ncbi:MAG: hypothetical protein HY791_34895 [Deltaproteobacteria bacterium]|nr:hypothetical protein [Deltaproteobacteria bacterium]
MARKRGFWGFGRLSPAASFRAASGLSAAGLVAICILTRLDLGGDALAHFLGSKALAFLLPHSFAPMTALLAGLATLPDRRSAFLTTLPLRQFDVLARGVLELLAPVALFLCYGAACRLIWGESGAPGLWLASEASLYAFLLGLTVRALDRPLFVPISVLSLLLLVESGAFAAPLEPTQVLEIARIVFWAGFASALFGFLLWRPKAPYRFLPNLLASVPLLVGVWLGYAALIRSARVDLTAIQAATFTKLSQDAFVVHLYERRRPVARPAYLVTVSRRECRFLGRGFWPEPRKNNAVERPEFKRYLGGLVLSSGTRPHELVYRQGPFALSPEGVVPLSAGGDSVELLSDDRIISSKHGYSVLADSSGAPLTRPYKHFGPAHPRALLAQESPSEWHAIDPSSGEVTIVRAPGNILQLSRDLTRLLMGSRDGLIRYEPLTGKSERLLSAEELSVATKHGGLRGSDDLGFVVFAKPSLEGDQVRVELVQVDGSTGERKTVVPRERLAEVARKYWTIGRVDSNAVVIADPRGSVRVRFDGEADALEARESAGVLDDHSRLAVQNGRVIRLDASGNALETICELGS